MAYLPSLQEDIVTGQRVRNYTVSFTGAGHHWITVRASAIGRKRIHMLPFIIQASWVLVSAGVGIV